MRAAAEEYLVLGYDAIPLRPGLKNCLLDDWPIVDAARQWEGAPPGCNVGLRHGGAMQLASIEAEFGSDNAPMLRRYLAGLGIDDLPVVESARGGERYYFRLQDAPPGRHAVRMADEAGAGEFRFGPGAQAVAPPSVFEGGTYRLIAGAWDGRLPMLEWLDIAPLLQRPQKPAKSPTVAVAPPSELARGLAAAQDLPADVRARLKGEGGTQYKSQDDFALVYRLAALGIDADGALALMLAYPCYGHFARLYREQGPGEAVQWLTDAHARALAYVAVHGSDTDKALSRLIDAAHHRPWPGRTGATDKAVLLAHLQIARDADVIVWAGSCRSVGERINKNADTAAKATRRLCDAGLLECVNPKSREYYFARREAATYTVPTAVMEGLQNDEDALSPTLLIWSHPQRSVGLSAHDLFSWHGLRAETGEIYGALLELGEATPAELAERTGRHIQTAKRALQRLATVADRQTGELYPLAEELPGGEWRAVAGADLDFAADLVGALGVNEKRKQKHLAERAAHAKALQRLQDGEAVPHPSAPPPSKQVRERAKRIVELKHVGE